MSAASQLSTQRAVFARARPVRTCVGCKARAPKPDLLRVRVLPSTPDAPQGRSGVLLPDPRGRAGGRGAYVHPDPACVEQAARRGALARALRVSAPVEITPVWDYLKTSGSSAVATPVGPVGPVTRKAGREHHGHSMNTSVMTMNATVN